MNRSDVSAGDMVEVLPVNAQLGTILANIAQEVGRLSILTREVEAGVFDMVQARDSLQTALSPRLHYLDFIVQSLDELAAVLNRLCSTPVTSLEVDVQMILGPVKLDMLRQSLVRTAALKNAGRQASSPEIELF